MSNTLTERCAPRRFAVDQMRAGMRLRWLHLHKANPPKQTTGPNIQVANGWCLAPVSCAISPGGLTATEARKANKWDVNRCVRSDRQAVSEARLLPIQSILSLMKFWRWGPALLWAGKSLNAQPWHKTVSLEGLVRRVWFVGFISLDHWTLVPCVLVGNWHQIWGCCSLLKDQI